MSGLFQGFSPDEAESVKREFVCAICHAELLEIRLDGEYNRLLICPEHGNVEDCGRVTRTTVSIEMERAKVLYDVVIRNLDDLWGELIPKDENPTVAYLKSYIVQERYKRQEERRNANYRTH